MSAEGEPDLLSQLEGVEHRRRLEAVAGLLSAIAVGQLFFAAFAFGHAQGPASLPLSEVLVGITGAFFLSVVAAALLRRRRLERSAERVLKVMEGRRRRRIALYERHFTIDDEVVLAAAVQTAERSDANLVLRYLDPRHGGPVLRELEGDEVALDAISASAQTAER